MVKQRRTKYLETESRDKLKLEKSPKPTGTQRRTKYLETESRDKLKLEKSPKPIGTQKKKKYWTFVVWRMS
jgi:hypothetical protein